jgi:hypothetical protein
MPARQLKFLGCQNGDVRQRYVYSHCTSSESAGCPGFSPEQCQHWGFSYCPQMLTGPPDMCQKWRLLIYAKFMHLHTYIHNCSLFTVHLYASWVWHFLEHSPGYIPECLTQVQCLPPPSLHIPVTAHYTTLHSFAFTFCNRNLTLSISPFPDEGMHTIQDWHFMSPYSHSTN